MPDSWKWMVSVRNLYQLRNCQPGHLPSYTAWQEASLHWRKWNLQQTDWHQFHEIQMRLELTYLPTALDATSLPDSLRQSAAFLPRLIRAAWLRCWGWVQIHPFLLRCFQWPWEHGSAPSAGISQRVFSWEVWLCVCWFKAWQDLGLAPQHKI